MNSTVRFGRRIPVPSTVQILHELMAFSPQQDVRERCVAEGGAPGTTFRAEIVSHKPGQA